MKIWIDADACPKVIKDTVYKVVARTKVPAILVANSYMEIPLTPLISFVKVDHGADVADMYIVDNITSEDIAITADIPLAALIVEKNAIAINPRGELYTEENIRERLSVRDFMKEMRDNGGVDTGGPAPFGPKDKEKFTNSFNKIMTQMLKSVDN